VKLYNEFNKDCESFRTFDETFIRETSRRSYHYNLNEFMRFAKLTDYDTLAKKSNDVVQKLLENWVVSLKKKDLVHNTISTKLNAVELFLDMNDKIWNRKKVRKMLPDSDRLPGGDVPFTTEEISRLKQVAKKLRDIAVIDFLASTGVRPGCFSDPVLRLKHLHDMPDGCKAVMVYDDSIEGYWAFLTPEATQSLNRYLSWRRFNHEELTQESVLFKNYDNPNKKKDYLTADSVRQTLTNLMKLAGIERKKIKNRHDKAIIYGFRIRFNTNLKLEDGLNSNIAEKLMGHKRGLDGHYFKPTREQCFEEFRKAIPELTISNEARDKAKIAKLERKNSKIEELELKVDHFLKTREREDKVSADLVAFYETGDSGYLKNFPPEYLEAWRMWKALRAKGKKVKAFSWPIESIPDDIKQLIESN